jgi:hypothetical protein
MFWAVALGAVGVAAIGWAFFQRLRSRMSQSWPTVEGKLRDAQVVVQEGARSLPKAETRYLYEVGSRLYTGSRIHFGDALPSPRRRDADALIAQLQQGALAVHYNPRNPHDAVLDPHNVPRFTSAIGFGITCLGLAAIAAVVVDQEWIRRERDLRLFVTLLATLAYVYWIRR